ncbi:(2Fe-2S) ferredoxin [Cohaesibacter sp. ES.047]|uniref:(2Fe-2S) ferredoxin domain-containing protein n=1 Tax=Cohaesibacter sp. ES.047 TaxID=1798205 RepID=UPI000BB733EF|nr:(2Fe-2S) ferredoxin domain-containing protein [Cohaesibacter sp. ES.047]SNY93160.1 (2Fe-2S) ferredoxin [Cohaesibacter sp. ES.047]
MKPYILLLAKAAMAAKPREELQGLCEAISARNPHYTTTYALQELGTPSLRARLGELADLKVPEVIIVSLIFPMEPAFPAWIRKSVHRWIEQRGDAFFPRIRIAHPPIGETDRLCDMIEALTFAADESDIVQERVKVPKGTVVPDQKYRLLVCMGGACNDAGASVLYSHLRSEQDRLKLRDSGAGMMSCKTSCLGPCSLAPVVQVWPEGTVYGGVDEKDIDEILDNHIQNGAPIDDLSYPTNGKKQTLK